MIRSKLSLTLLIALLSLPETASYADGGKDGGNGGDSYTIEFAAYGQSIVKHWEELEFSASFPVILDEFRYAVKKAELHSTTDKLHVDGFEVDSKNFEFCKESSKPKPKYCGVILINRARWNALGDDMLKKAALAFHEYLGVLGKNDQRFDDFYEQSGKYFERLKSLLSMQMRVQVGFLCLLETWNAKSKTSSVLHQLEASDGMTDQSFRIKDKEYNLELRPIPEDLFSPKLINGLSYTLYPKKYGQLPDRDHPLSSRRVSFSNGKKSLRILNDPELQLTCFRILQGFK